VLAALTLAPRLALMLIVYSLDQLVGCALKIVFQQNLTIGFDNFRRPNDSCGYW
jgi:hypothetical protein